MRYCLHRSSVKAEPVPGDTVAVLTLFDDDRGCEKFAQRVLSFEAGRSAPRMSHTDDEVLFVLSGFGGLEIGDGGSPLAPGVGFHVSRGTQWAVEAGPGLELVSVLIHDPEPGSRAHGLVDLAAESRRSATAARQFVLGATPASGCLSVTQFIGFVPPGRAPDHFHRYDEVLYILEGSGVLHIGGEAAPLEPGACVHLPAQTIHSLENTGATELRLLGVFRPAGSPAEAYYPDGTPAAYPEES